MAGHKNGAAAAAAVVGDAAGVDTTEGEDIEGAAGGDWPPTHASIMQIKATVHATFLFMVIFWWGWAKTK